MSPFRAAVAKYRNLRNIRMYLIYYLFLITAVALHVKILRRSSAIDAVAIDSTAYCCDGVSDKGVQSGGGKI